VVSSPATELLAVTGEEDTSTVVKDLMAFPNATLGSFLQKGEALIVIFLFQKALYVICTTSAFE
jgi:hypothetical protein